MQQCQGMLVNCGGTLLYWYPSLALTSWIPLLVSITGPYKFFSQHQALLLHLRTPYRTFVFTDGWNRILCYMVGMERIKSPYPNYFCSQSETDHSQTGCVLAGIPVRVGDFTGVDTRCCAPASLVLQNSLGHVHCPSIGINLFFSNSFQSNTYS